MFRGRFRLRILRTIRCGLRGGWDGILDLPGMAQLQQFLSRNMIDVRQGDELGCGEFVLFPLDSGQPAWRDLEFLIPPLLSKLCALFRDFSGRELRFEAQGTQLCADPLSLVYHDNSPGIHRGFPAFYLHGENQILRGQIGPDAILANPVRNFEALADSIGEGAQESKRSSHGAQAAGLDFDGATSGPNANSLKT